MNRLRKRLASFPVIGLLFLITGYDSVCLFGAEVGHARGSVPVQRIEVPGGTYVLDDISISPDGQYLAFINRADSAIGTLGLLSLRERRFILTSDWGLIAKKGITDFEKVGFTAVTFSPDSKVLITARTISLNNSTRKEVVEFRDPASGKKWKESEATESVSLDIQYSSKRREIVTVGPDRIWGPEKGKLVVRDAESLAVKAVRSIPKSIIYPARFSKNEQLALTAICYDNEKKRMELQYWDEEWKRWGHPLAFNVRGAHKSPVYLSYDAQGSSMAGIYFRKKNTFELWNIDHGEKQSSFLEPEVKPHGYRTAHALSNDSKMLALADSGGSIRLLSTKTGETVSVFQDGAVPVDVEI